MSVRSRAALAGAPVAVAKVFGPGVPPAVQQAEAQSGMIPSSPFSPGTPVGPYYGFGRTPRSQDYVTGFNIATRPRTHERVSFETLRGLIDAYDVASIAIWHRIDSIRSLDWKLISADAAQGDTTDAVAAGMRVMESPDRENTFDAWLAKWLFDVLAYDAGCLYRLRNRAGRAVGLAAVDGTTVAPLLDYWGNRPKPPAEAYVQYVQGLPWNWLTQDDLVYQPFRPRTNSPYGHAPLETIMLNANTDLRFQLYFLERFTAGSLPAAFASAPESWSPDQIEQFQELWDSFMVGNQEGKHQIRWLPPGSKFTWSNEKDFSDVFSLFLMRKTLAAYHVVPADVGFTENVNKSSGESQADVSHKVGEAPLVRYVQRILTRFLQNDLALPLKFTFDLGEEQADRQQQAQADKVYFDMGAIGASEIREMRYGLTDAVPIPRTIMTSRGGPVPIASLLAIAGEIDPATALPALGAALPRDVFGGVEGVLPEPPVKVTPLAEREYGPSAMPPAPPPQPQLEDNGQVAKEGEGAAGSFTAGITSETGLFGYDLGDGDDEPGSLPVPAPLRDEDMTAVAKELSAFRRYSRARRKAGEWRDFRFDHLPAGHARRLNAEGRTAVAKDGVPGLTSRSGMISLDLPEGLIEPLPGGVADFHVTVVYLGSDVPDEAFAAACSRAASAAASVPGPLSGTVSGIGAFPPSDSSDGKVPAWAAVGIPGAEVLRQALEDLSASGHRDWTPHVTLAYLDPGEPLPAPLEPAPVTFTHLSVHRGDQVERFPLGPGVTAVKAAMPVPKRPGPPAGRRESPRPPRVLALTPGPAGP